jgi:DNA-binding TFAR19-related protein (PDSD5 family)
MSQIETLIWPEMPQDLENQLIAVLKEKLPTPVDDSILKDIIQSQNKIFEDFLKNKIA